MRGAVHLGGTAVRPWIVFVVHVVSVGSLRLSRVELDEHAFFSVHGNDAFRTRRKDGLQLADRRRRYFIFRRKFHIKMKNQSTFL